MIVASMCTIPVRKQSFRQVAQRILREQTQPIDRLHVWLNGYQAIDDDLPKDPRVEYHLEPDNPGPWVRFRVAETLRGEERLVTLDDDLIYPRNYVERGLDSLKENNSHSCITFGGFRWDCLLSTFKYDSNRQHISFGRGLSSQRQIALLMSGVSFYWASHLRSVSAFFQRDFSMNDDMSISLFLQKRGIDIVCCPKPDGWIQEQETARASHALFWRDRDTRQRMFTRMVEQLGFDPTAGALEKMLSRPRRLVVFAGICPPLAGSEALDEYLRSLCAEDSGVHLVAPAPLSLSSQVQTYVDTPYYIHAVPVPEPGGRFEGLAPVRAWRNLRVDLHSMQALRSRSKAAIERLRPTEIYFWPAGWRPNWLGKVPATSQLPALPLQG